MSIHLEVRSYRGGDRHAHPFGQFLLPLHGAMRLDLEGRREVVADNCLALIPCHCEHLFEPTPDCLMMVLDIEAQGLRDGVAPLWLGSPRPALVPIEPWLWRMFRQLGAEVEAGGCPAGDAARLTVAGLHLVSPASLPQPLSPARQRVLAQADSSAETDVAEMARLAGLGQSQFHALFRATTGGSPKQMQLARRFERAAEALLASAAPISDIAYGLGYKDVSAFNRQFRRRFGMTPGAFRAAGRSDAR